MRGGATPARTFLRPSGRGPARTAAASGAGRGRRWAVAGALLGALFATVAFAPASWLARAVAQASDGRVLLVASRGTVWSGDAMLVLAGGAGSRDATVLPDRIDWRLRGSGLALRLDLRQACCINGVLSLRLLPGVGRLAVEVPGGGDWLAQWPSDVLRGLGTPFNTLQLGGTVRLASPQGLRLEGVQGRWRVVGGATAELLHASSRLTTLDTLGSYRLRLDGPAEGGPATLELQTLEGALRLSGSGTWSPQGVRFQGEARAAEAQRPVLDNLLNIIGRRDGDRSVISIG